MSESGVLRSLKTSMVWAHNRLGGWRSSRARRALQKDWRRTFDDASPAYAVIAFSKDRPLQLHGLLRSYLDLGPSASSVNVLFLASSPAYASAYAACAKLFADEARIRFVGQRDAASFREDLMRMIRSTAESRLLFLVDDIVCIRPFDLRDFDGYDLRTHVPSLRLGRTVTYSYTTGKTMHLPNLLSSQQGRLFWQWKDNDLDWAYPLSVDGHIYLRTEITAMLDRLTFHSPNTLEAEMQRFRDLYEDRRGVSYETPRLVNLPLNLVQDDFPNRHGNLTQDLLLSRWNDGYAMDVGSLRALEADSVHVELDIHFIPRGDARDV